MEKGLIADGMLQSGEYCEGEKVRLITYIPEGSRLRGWKSSLGSSAFNDAKAVTTIVTMPAGNIAIEADIVNGYFCGDADDDGILTASDAAAVLQKVLDNNFKIPCEESHPDDYKAICDVDSNHILTASDSACILQKVLNSSFIMPCEKQ